jgi:ACR3 family arsenite transporter
MTAAEQQSPKELGPEAEDTSKDVEKLEDPAAPPRPCVSGGGDDDDDMPALKKLGWIDRLLALWIILAMAVGLILGNFVPKTGPALQKGNFVGVSVPIGKERSCA